MVLFNMEFHYTMAESSTMQSRGELQISALCPELVNFSAKDTISSWPQSSDLSSHIYRHLAVYVPRIYSRGPDLDSQSEDLLCQMVLLSPLEWFLCGDEPSVRLAQLEENRSPSHLCGHVFKMGEPTYSCRECANDPTCVLCTECFLRSVHKDHRYRMCTSGGGGFCDCGDDEAWKKAPSCQKHQPDATDSREAPLSQLSDDMTARCSNVFSVIVKYAVDLLTWEQEDQLPLGLVPPEQADDTFCCMLYNDEVHTYEQVIYTLMKDVGCTNKEAIGFASTVNRDGRKSVRFGDFQSCEQARSVIVSSANGQSKPLRVQVMHSSVVAHQCFALKALSWLGRIIGYSEALRRVLCQVILQRGPEGQSLVDTLMLCDFKMWKGARNMYHQLLMSTLFMDPKYKSLFAIQFAKHYEQLQNNYAENDHDKDSITSLSVQIFTVPSLTHMLMIEEDLMKTIIKCFMGHLRHKPFDHYALIQDLKYVLTCRPTEWTDQLRGKFLEGLDAFLELLKSIQGVDPVVRLKRQHIDMQEPEWSWILQRIMTPVILLIQRWCASDERVLTEAYRKVLCALSQCCGSSTEGKQPVILSLAGHSVETIPYLVSQEEVSIHWPVSRLMAGLQVLLSETELAYRCPEQLPLSELNPLMLVEHSLRCLVFCAQVYAGMWRGSGLSDWQNRIIYYHSVECRREMFDKDLLMLQVGASMMDPDNFLMLVLNRFELFHVFHDKKYSRDTNMKKVQQMLIAEMLHVIIMVVGERYVCGLSKVHSSEEIRREIIHQLSMKAMSHSELLKSLPENVNEETGIEQLIDSVALFKKKPDVTGRGLYELRPGSSKLFNLYFYHYSRRDRSMAEEAQRKLKRQNGENSVLLPPVPPPLSPLFAGLANLLQCDVLLVILGAVLQWAVEPSTGHWSESMLQRVLHLIGMSLLEEQQQIEKSSGRADITFNFTSKIARPLDGGSNSASILALLETLHNAPHMEVHKDMVHWILTMVSNIRTRTEHTVLCVSTDTTTTHAHNKGEKDKVERKKRKAELAQLHRQKIMAQMSKMQKQFLNGNIELLEQSLDEMNEAPVPGSLSDPSPDVLVCVGPGRSGSSELQLVICILCQEEQKVTAHGKAIVMAAFVQRSTVLSLNRSTPLPDPEHHDPLFIHPELNCGTHTGSCGHVMHASCWQRYFEAELDKERRSLRVIPKNDVENGEFLCPLCRRLSNAVIPILPRTHRHTHSGEQKSLEEWLKLTCQQVAALHTDTKKGLKPVLDLTPTKPFSSDIKEMVSTFGMATYKVGLNVKPNDHDPRVPIITWNSCAFTIQSIERLLADEERPIFEGLPSRQDGCLTSLCRVASTCWMSSPLSTVHAHFIRLFSAVVPDPQVENTPCILDVDMFHLLVSSLMSYSSVQGLGQSGQSIVDSAHLHLFHLLTVAHLVQIMISSVPGEATMEQEESGGAGNEEEEEELTLLLYNKVRSHLDSLPEVCSGRHLWRRVRKGVEPFLRLAALLFNHLNSAQTPSALQVAGPGQWEALCAYLALPANLLQLYHRHSPLMDTLIQGWCSHGGVRRALQGNGPLVRYPRRSNRLIELPEDYSCLINKALSFACPSAPAMCLVCGAMVCSQSYCCLTEAEGVDIGNGSLIAHSHTCGAGLGIYLVVRSCQVLFLYGRSVHSYAPPYLDDYGETDEFLARGNPLHLSSGHYLKIQSLWRQHSIAEEIGYARAK